MKVQNDVARAPDERRVANIMIVKHVLIHEVLLLAWQLQGLLNANSNSVLSDWWPITKNTTFLHRVLKPMTSHCFCSPLHPFN